MYTNLFLDCEQRGREAVIKFLESRPEVANISPTTNPYDRIDLYCTYAGHGVAIEIKTRKAVYTSGQIIEETKLQALLDARKDPAIRWSYYVNVVGPVLYFWPIDERALSLRQYHSMLPATTVTGEDARVKAYRLLPISWATLYSVPGTV